MFALPDLPYAYDALEPTLSADTLHLHHDKHHKAYVTNVNDLLSSAGQRPQSLEAVVRDATAQGQAKLFNNAGQAWNHALFWLSMTADRSGPQDALSAAIDQAFGGLAGLRERFITEGVGHFGSGWVWLVSRGGKLEVTTTHDGETVLTREGVTPLLVCDLWEHAYYLDYQNDRKGYLGKWFDSLADWRFAARQMEPGSVWRYPAPTSELAHA